MLTVLRVVWCVKEVWPRILNSQSLALLNKMAYLKQKVSRDVLSYDFVRLGHKQDISRTVPDRVAKLCVYFYQRLELKPIENVIYLKVIDQIFELIP